MESDAPDALPKSMSTSDSLFLVEGDSSSNPSTAETDASMLNHPANILNVSLAYLLIPFSGVICLRGKKNAFYAPYLLLDLFLAS